MKLKIELNDSYMKEIKFDISFFLSFLRLQKKRETDLSLILYKKDISVSEEIALV